MEFWRESDCDCGIESWRGGFPRVRSRVEEGVRFAIPPVPMEMLRVEVEEEERWCLRWEGWGCEGPERRWFAFVSVESGIPVEVEEALDTTEAFCAARSMESSRVSRLTY